MKRINSKGFTIIEVLIVMAIAAVIVVGILLAVPALQRNNRNSTRTTEGGRIAALVNECLSNKNGVTTSCDYVGTPNGASSPEIDYVSSDFQQLVAMDIIPSAQPFVVPVAAAANANPTAIQFNANKAIVAFNGMCNATGDNAIQSTRGTRSFVVLFQIETSSGSATRCLSS